MLYFSIWKIIGIISISLCGFIFTLPNILTEKQIKYLPSFMPDNKLHLGLDLKGGSYILLKVDTDKFINDYMNNIKNQIRLILREKKIGYTSLKIKKNNIYIKIRKEKQMNNALTAISKAREKKFIPFISNKIEINNIKNFNITQTSRVSILITLTKEKYTTKIKSNIEQSIEILRRRIDSLGIIEPTIQSQNINFILIQVPGINSEKLKKIIGKTAKLTFHEVDMDADPNKFISLDNFVLSDSKNHDQKYVLKKHYILSGKNLINAQVSFSQKTNEVIILFKFDKNGAKKFSNYSMKHIGEPFAIVLDNKVISIPIINQAIHNGIGQISGEFSIETANELAILLNSGTLPISLKIIEERSVGPSLGVDNIKLGKISSIIGFIIVIIFMILSYGLFGIFASFALIINLILITGFLSMIQATLSLPGIIGIILTIGMAVDANILIFERIREELSLYKLPIIAITIAYKRVLKTILDTNITTFIIAIILFYLGSGPIKGFAITLSIGIITSVFTSFIITRLFMSIWLKYKKPKTILF